MALRGGLTGFPKRLAGGLDVRHGVEVRSLAEQDGHLVATDEAGLSYRARVAVLTPPAPQSSRLLASIGGGSREIEAMRSLLGMVACLPCLTVLAGYPTDAPAPVWQVLYPEDSRVLHVVSLDSDKRVRPDFAVLVLQGLPGWSRAHLEDDPERWADEVLDEARRLVAPWAGAPVWYRAHRWRYARAGTGNELTQPMIGSVPGGARVGLAGEIFSPGGGVQGAWRSGRRLAARLIEESVT